MQTIYSTPDKNSYINKSYILDFELKFNQNNQYFYSYKISDNFFVFTSAEYIKSGEVIEIILIEPLKDSLLIHVKKSNQTTSTQILTAISYRIPLDPTDNISLNKFNNLDLIYLVSDGTNNIKIAAIVIKNIDSNSLLSLDLNDKFLINFILSN